MSGDDSWRIARPAEAVDPIELQIQQEIEEFLRDLVLEFPFHAVFDCLRRYEIKERLGQNILPLPHRKSSGEDSKEIRTRIEAMLESLHSHFGSKYSNQIQEAFRYYTATTRD